MMKRRQFIRYSAAAMTATGLPGLSLAGTRPAGRRPVGVTILHTNDWHSRIDPFPDDGSRNAGAGGALRRAALIRRVRQEGGAVLLLDSGDIFQGTPYFNFFLGELEMKLMTRMGYDAATIGNHDFDGGLENLARQLDHADFPLLSANYDFRDTPMEGRTEPYRLFERGGLRIGVFGIGIELAGLVPSELTGKTEYLDPVERANTTALHLRSRKKCDLVVCLSHLGYRYEDDNRVSDVVLAAASRNIDIILGGHTHTFMEAPVEIPNREGESVVVNQVGFGGLLLGRLDVTFGEGERRMCTACHNLRV